MSRLRDSFSLKIFVGALYSEARRHYPAQMCTVPLENRHAEEKRKQTLAQNATKPQRQPREERSEGP